MPAPMSKRKCRNPECGKVSVLAFMVENCPVCKTPYGPWEIGLDQSIPTPPTKGRSK